MFLLLTVLVFGTAFAAWWGMCDCCDVEPEPFRVYHTRSVTRRMRDERED